MSLFLVTKIAPKEAKYLQHTSANSRSAHHKQKPTNGQTAANASMGISVKNMPY